MNLNDFSNPENWRGGPSYGLTIGWPVLDDAQMLRAMRALFVTPRLRGPWASPERFLGPVQFPAMLDREVGGNRYALLRLADGTELGCRLLTILNELAVSDRGTGMDWLELVVMRGMQERAFDLVYSDHFQRDNPWLDQLDTQLLALAESVYAVVPFDFAVIDYEGLFPFAGELYPNIAEQLRMGGLLLPPAARALLPEDDADWAMRESGLYWLPSREA